jgi:hypothetical protein
MPDTQRTTVELQAIFADGQANRSITEQDFRDFVVSVWTKETSLPVGPQGPVGAAGPQGSTGAAGPNNVTGSTTTTLTGFLSGNGSVVSATTNGSTLTNLSASNISTGSLNDSRLSNNIARRDIPNTFASNMVVGGTLTVSGVITGDGSGLSALNGSAITSGTINTARLNYDVVTTTSANHITSNVNTFIASDGDNFLTIGTESNAIAQVVIQTNTVESGPALYLSVNPDGPSISSSTGIVAIGGTTVLDGIRVLNTQSFNIGGGGMGQFPVYDINGTLLGYVPYYQTV